MIENLEQYNDRYSTTLRQYEKIVSKTNSIPLIISNLKAKKNRFNQKEKAISLRKRIIFNQNFLALAKKYSEQLSISPFTSTTQNTLRLRSYIKDPTSLSSDTYIIKSIGASHETNASDIFALGFQWKREKPKFKPKEYTFRAGRKQELDFTDYSPNYSYIYKKVPYVKFSPLPKKSRGQIQKEELNGTNFSNTKSKRFKKEYGSLNTSTRTNAKYNQTTAINTRDFSFRG